MLREMGLWLTSLTVILGVDGDCCPHYTSVSSRIIFFAAAKGPLEWVLYTKRYLVLRPKVLR